MEKEGTDKMTDLIKRSDALEVAYRYCPDDDGSCSCADRDLREMLNDMEDIPSADRPQGYWAMRDKCEFRCSNCGKIIFADCEKERNYCPNCGSKNRINWLLKWDDMPLKGADDDIDNV